ncbi:uncharacterized protein B0H18DRAFT_1024278, partial [Fomitopsis serialis]|uniref:uncharacterized protein n=1 Tax=Fomitopsis serialis TaxID=139415 RepID=UPI002007E30E
TSETPAKNPSLEEEKGKERDDRPGQQRHLPAMNRGRKMETSEYDQALTLGAASSDPGAWRRG